MALVGTPSILLTDEPTGRLSVKQAGIARHAAPCSGCSATQTPLGAHLPLQVRTAELNGDLRGVLERWYPGLVEEALPAA